MGRIVKPHGLRGEVVVDLVSNRAERAAPGARFAAGAGSLEVLSVRPFQGRWLMTFGGVTTREAAESLRGTRLLAEALADDDVLWVHELVGTTVVDQASGQAKGRVVAVVANPASDLLELEDGHLVPTCFVVRRDAGTVVVDVPAGMWD
ncbi:MAG: ribosome maturation factor RimM [Acidimicrobiales bacterium]